MLAANKRAKRTSNPKRKKKRAKKSNPRRTTKRAKCANPKRSGHHKKKKNPRRKKRRRNPGMMSEIWAALKPAAYAGGAAGVGLLGSFGLAMLKLQSRTAVVIANAVAGTAAGVGVGYLDKSAGMIAAAPFMLTAGQNMLAGAIVAAAAKATPAATQTAITGLNDKLLEGLHEISGIRQLNGVVADDLGDIMADDLESVIADDLGEITYDDVAYG